MLHSPVSGTSPSSPSCSLPLPHASSAASSPSVPLDSPLGSVHMSALPPAQESNLSASAAAAASYNQPSSSSSPSLGAVVNDDGGSGEGNDGGETGLRRTSLTGAGSEQATTPLLSRFDPYHGTTCFVHHPFTQKPLSSDELRDSLQRALMYGSSQLAWKLNYHDVAPAVEGLEDGTLRSAENFRDLLERANKWLTQNPQYSIRSCESVTWWTTEQVHVGDTEAVLLEQAGNVLPTDDTIYLMGLRLWVVTKEQNTPIQRLRVRDFHPTEQEPLSHLLKRANKQLEEAPCQGSIVTIETVPYADVNSRDSDITLWRESQCKQGIYTIFLRIFYVDGPTKQETIGIRDFVPEVLTIGSDPLGTLVKNAKHWVNEEKSIRLMNFRAAYITRDPDSAEVAMDRTSQPFFRFDVHHYITVLRVFYIQLPRADTGAPYQIINYVTFTPVQLLPGENTEVDYEKMRQTMARVSAWIKAAGANILCCESVITPLYPHIPTQTLPEITHWEPVPGELHAAPCYSKKFLFHIRLYLQGTYQSPDPQALLPLPASLTAALQASILERERRHYRRKRKRRKRRRSIMIVLSAMILTVIIGVIVVDQSLNVFGL